MLVPLAPSPAPLRSDRAASRPAGRRAARWAVRVLLIAGAALLGPRRSPHALAAAAQPRPPSTQRQLRRQTARTPQTHGRRDPGACRLRCSAAGARRGVPGAGDR